ncbi:Panacea domain-containing protein [Candidatus Poriferisodalis sp.]|uniref:Panacea domain-containing protein n=1 Tax=Candidatus Poriferisodalis sp. TaxID=3101277 RepID=UPI003B5B8E2D
MAAVELTDVSRYGMDAPPGDERLQEAILYVARRLEDDPAGRGAVKLNKILWWADFESFRERLRSVTGAMYQKLPEGPAPVRQVPAREALIEEGAVELRQRDIGAPHPENVLRPLREPQQLFDADDLHYLDMALDKFRGMTGGECSEFSHWASVGWRAVDFEQVIPYETSIIDPRPLTEEARARGVEMAIAAGFIAE